MDECGCPFGQALLPGDFGCRRATVVTRREGPGIACDSLDACNRCAEVLARLKETGLPALGFTDDPAQLPHGAAMKVQMGGLLGLQRQLDALAGASAVVADVDALVGAAVARYGSAGALPYAQLVPDMGAFQLKRRRR
jgi:hypothetical protein